MNDRAKRIARLALFVASGVVLLVLANVLPGGRLALLAVASFPVCATVMMYGRLWSAGVFFVTAILGGLLLPGTGTILYVIFFGYYPILKSILENIRGTRLVWVLKYVVYTTVFALYLVLARTVFVASAGEMNLPWLILYIAGAAVFFVYDWCYSVMIRLYIEKIARYFP